MAMFTRGHAVVIGVGGDLPITVHDAQAIEAILRDTERAAFPARQVRVVLDKQATRSQVLSALETLATEVKQDAVALIYFSGHGYQIKSKTTPESYYLLTYGYNIDDPVNTCISGEEFTTRLRAIRCKNLLVLLDCCHAGGIGQPKDGHLTLKKSPIPPQADEVLFDGTGRVILASSRADEISYTGRPYSEFTSALVEALAGAGASEQDGLSRVLDMALYVGRTVSNRTRDKQHPIIKVAHLENNFAVAYYAGGSKEPLQPRGPVTSPVSTSPSMFDIELLAGYRDLIRRYRHHLLEIEVAMSQFVDQRVVPPDLVKAREGVLRKIDELEKCR